MRPKANYDHRMFSAGLRVFLQRRTDSMLDTELAVHSLGVNCKAGRWACLVFGVWTFARNSVPAMRKEKQEPRVHKVNSITIQTLSQCSYSESYSESYSDSYSDSDPSRQVSQTSEDKEFNCNSTVKCSAVQ